MLNWIFLAVLSAPCDDAFEKIAETSKDSLPYYESNADLYVADSSTIIPHRAYLKIQSRLRIGDHIADFGCGSGRDSLHFLQDGYQVTPIDGSKELAKRAEERLGIPVLVSRFEELDLEGVFDGGFALASIVHIPRENLPNVFRRVFASLKPGAPLFLTFGYGEKDFTIPDGRFFTAFTEATFAEFLKAFPFIDVVEIKKEEVEFKGNKFYSLEAMLKRSKDVSIP